MAAVIAILNQKGGVGKTTTAINLAASLASLPRPCHSQPPSTCQPESPAFHPEPPSSHPEGPTCHSERSEESLYSPAPLSAGAEPYPRVLVVDCDPQAHATTSLGIQPSSVQQSVYDAICDGADVRPIIKPSCQQGLDILPSTIDLAGAEVELASAMARETRLKTALAPVLSEYDFILLDTPPSLGLLTINALTAADYVLVPVQAEYYALASLPALSNTIRLVQQHLNPRLSILGVVVTMYDHRTRLAREVADEVRRHFGELMFDSTVPRSVRVSEAPSHGLPLSLYDPSSKANAAYADIARQISIKLQFAYQDGLQGHQNAQNPNVSRETLPTHPHPQSGGAEDG